MAAFVLFVSADRRRPPFRCCSAAMHSLKPPRNTTLQLVSTTEIRNETITFGEKIYRMVFKRSPKKADGEKAEGKTEGLFLLVYSSIDLFSFDFTHGGRLDAKKEEPTTTVASTDGKAAKHEKHHHKSGHKKHKHKHHHHTKDNNGTDVDWHSIG